MTTPSPATSTLGGTDTTGANLPATRPAGPAGGRAVRAAIWFPGLAVAIGAAVATAHGLYEVAAAASVPAVIAWLYPLITDGLALVAYTSTARLTGSGARYAWSVVVLAAGLSGLAQAAFLAAGSSVEASPALRFGVGAWPAVAAAIVAHLLYLLATDDPAAMPSDTAVAVDPTDVDQAGTAAVDDPELTPPAAVHSWVSSPAAVRPPSPAVQPFTTEPVQPDPVAVHPAPAVGPVLAPVKRRDRPVGGSPARDRARAAAARHAQRHGHLPTVSELETLAEVSRGTAAAVLKHLRDHPTPLHLITTDREQDDPAIEESTQP